VRHFDLLNSAPGTTLRKRMLLSPKSPANQNNGTSAAAAAAGSSSAALFSTPQPPSRPQHIFTPASASSAPPQSTFLNTHTHSTNSHHARAKRQQFPSTNTTPSQQLSFHSSHTLATSGHGTAASGSTNNNYEHSFMIEQPLSTSEHTATKESPYSAVRRDRLGTFESVMAVRSLGSGGKMASRRKNNHSDMVQQILSASVTANERVDGRDTSTSNDDDASDVSSLSDDGTAQGAAAATNSTTVASGRTMASLLKKPRAIRKKKTIPIRPNPISGRQSSDHAASSIATTSITSATHTMETIECSFPSPLTAEISVEKVKSSKDLMGNNSIHRRSQSSISGVSFQLGGGGVGGSNHRSPMIHDAWLSPGRASGYGGDSSSIQPKEGEDLIDITTDAPIDPFSGLIGMPSSSLSMCDNSFASGTTASLAEKPKTTSSFLRKPAMVSRSKTEEFDPFSKVKSEIPRAPRYLRDNPLLSKSRYRVRSSPKRQHTRAPSLDNACMIGSIAMSETNAAASVTTSTSADKEEEEEDLVSNLPPIVQKTTEEADDDSDSSYASFSEELNRKNRGKAFVGDVRNLMEKVLPVAKTNETKLQRSSEGCLT